MSWYSHNGVDSSSLPDLCYDEVERLLIRAYVSLIFMPMDTYGSRTAIVAQFYSLEVRLTEFPDAYITRDRPPLWIEIYSHATRSIVDSCECFEFDEDELSTAAELILQAKQHQGVNH
ncbi:hypothetical protein ACD578_29610 (plasmid) [Microvirga sp. RSM25]|uniref:hypothetical protein n=1 Tax=Microvirga sp. RSM25 TaxID=3273802 RepID=UPI00384B8468